jgi:hypothetical protein
VRREVFSRDGWGQGVQNIWFVGSWVGGGIPLLEGCVESAETVAEMVRLREMGESEIWEHILGVSENCSN